MKAGLWATLTEHVILACIERHQKCYPFSQGLTLNQRIFPSPLTLFSASLRLPKTPEAIKQYVEDGKRLQIARIEKPH